MKRANVVLPKSSYIRTEAIGTLINTLGITKAASFIRDNLSQPEDYLEIKRKLFKGEKAAHLYKKIKNT